MDNFLELCQWVQPRIGYSGTLADTAAASGDLAKIVSHVQEADSRLCRLYQDWLFLSDEETVTLAAGTATYPAPTDLSNYRRGLWPLTIGARETFLHVVPARGYAMPESNEGTPTVAILNPDKTIRFWPTPDAVGVVTVLYHKSAPRLAANADVSPIPNRFWEAIGWEAVRTLAKVESDEPLVVYSTEEANRWLSQLIAHELPDHHQLHYGSSNSMDFVVRAE